MSVGCGAEGGHEEPGLGEAGGPGVGGVHKGAFRPRSWPHTAQDPERRRRRQQRRRWLRFPIWRRALTSPEDVAAPPRGGPGCRKRSERGAWLAASYPGGLRGFQPSWCHSGQGLEVRSGVGLRCHLPLPFPSRSDLAPATSQASPGSRKQRPREGGPRRALSIPISPRRQLLSPSGPGPHDVLRRTWLAACGTPWL